MAKAKMKIRQTKADIVFDVFNTVFMVLLMFVILYPLYFTVIALNAPNILAASSRS